MFRIAVYYRVSTYEQTLDMQKLSVERWIEGFERDNGKCKVTVYEDIGKSGSDNDRPEFKKMITHAEEQRFDILLVYKLDRLTRDATTAIRMVLNLDSMGVEFVSATQRIFDHGVPFRRVMIALFAELAQMEREMIVERVKAGLDAAKARGVKLGAPTKKSEDIVNRAIELRDSGYTYKAVARKLSVSVGTIHSIIRKHKETDKAIA